jgi:hypothetical protein
MAERALETPDIRSTVEGEDAVRISRFGAAESESSGKPKMADRRLRINVLRVGRRRE